MNFHVVTLFPEVVEAYTQASILGRAQKNKKLKVKTYQLRDFVTNKWGKADERPYGGGPGMVLQAEPVIRAVEAIQKKLPKTATGGRYDIMKYHTKEKGTGGKAEKPRIILTAAGGKPLTNAYAKKLAKAKNVIIVCGRYEGIDARTKKILKAVGTEVDEVSVGPYILTGGEVPALAIIDATARQIPGVLGRFESLEEGRVASHDVFTRPEVLIHKGKSYRVPKVLLSGHHARIDALRSKKRSSSSMTLQSPDGMGKGA